MKRRHFLPFVAASSLAWADEPRVQSLADAKRWLDKLHKSTQAQATGAWPLSSVLEHLAQSIEMSLDGFPEPKSALFQNTVGAAAFSVFRWRARMTHSLSEPIPGAPALGTPADWRPASQRLRAAILRFESHQGVLRPHFAYGMLDKADYALAHSFHIANHQDEIRVA